MARRESFTARRRRMLSLRVASLEVYEGRHSIGDLSSPLGLALRAVAGAGLLDLVRGRALPAEVRRAAPVGTPARARESVVAQPAWITGAAAEAVLPLAIAPPIRRALPITPARVEPAGDWLALAPSDAAKGGGMLAPALPTSGASQPMSARGNAAGAVARRGAITPLRVAPRPDLVPPHGSTGGLHLGPAPGESPEPADARPYARDHVAAGSSSLIVSPTRGSDVAGGAGPEQLGGGRADAGGGWSSIGETDIESSPRSPIAFHELYVLDEVHGVALFEGSPQAVELGTSMTLSAHFIVDGMKYYSHEWDWSGMGHASGFSGTNMSLSFAWDATNATPAIDTLGLEIVVETSLHTQETISATYQFAVPSGSTSSWSAPMPTTTATDLRPDAPTIASHNSWVDVASGNLGTSVALASYSPNVAPLEFVYSSIAANPRPVVVLHYDVGKSHYLPTPWPVRSPSVYEVTGSALGFAAATKVYNKGGILSLPVSPYALVHAPVVLTPTDPLMATGRYDYDIQAVDIEGTARTTFTFSGQLNLINDAGSDFGAGWGLAGLERVQAGSGGVLLTTGGGAGLWFNAGSGGVYSSPAGEFSTLAVSGGTYTRTLPDGTRREYRTSDGRQVAAVDRNGLRVTYAYDGSGKLTTITDPYANLTTFAYDGSGKLRTVTDPANRVTTFAVSGGTLTGVTLPDGGTWAYSYADRRLTSLVDPRSQVVTFTYAVPDSTAYRLSEIDRPDGTTETFRPVQAFDSYWNGLVTVPAAPILVGRAATEYTDPRGRTFLLRTDWGGLGRVTQPTDADGRVATSNRDGTGETRSYVDRLGRVTRYTYDGLGNITGVVHPDGATEAAAYNAYSEPTSITDAMGRRTTLGYDAAGNLTSILRADPDGAGPLTSPRTTLTYTGSGRLESVLDARGNRVTYQYDSQDRLTTFINAGGSTTAARRWAYDSGGRVTTYTDERGNATTFQYDPMNRVTRVGDALGNPTSYTYDAAGNLTSERRPLGRTTTFAYDAMNRPTTMTDALSGTTTLRYDAMGLVDRRTDPLGRVTTYAYDAEDRLTTMVDPLNQTWRWAFDAESQLIAATDAMSRITTYAYDLRGRVSTVTDPLGRVTTAGYDAAGNLVTETRPLGRVTTFTYDALDRLTAVTNPMGEVTALGYDEVDHLTTSTDPNGNRTTYAYDARDRLTTVTRPLGLETGYSYDEAGNLVTEKDPLGRTTTYGYDALNRLETYRDPLGLRTTLSYDAAGNLTSVSEPLSRRTTYAYDLLDRVTTVTTPLNRVTTYGYDAAGNLTRISDPLGRVTTLVYDALDRQVAQIDPLGHRTTTTYDGVGRVTALVDGLGHATSLTYDNAGQLIAVTDGAGVATTYGYDAAGNRITETVPSNRVTTYAYDLADRVTTITDPLGAATRLLYDSGGRTTGLIDPAGNRTTFAYDAADRLTTVTDPRGSTTRYGYNASSDLTSVTDRDGRRTSYSYDSGGRRTNEFWRDAGGTITRRITYTYDNAHRLTRVADPDATITYAYDAADRLTTAQTAGPGTGQPNLTLAYGYDAADNRTSVVDDLASVGRTTYQYDAADRLTTLTRSIGGVAGPQVLFTYDAADRLTEARRTVGSASPTGMQVLVTTYSYDNADRLTGIRHRQGNSPTLGTLLLSETYSYDTAGRLSNGGAYGYDAADQLTSFGATTYGYDAAGNRNATGYAIDTGNRMTASPGATYTYDAEGNLTAKTETASGRVTTYAYDQRGRLTGVTRKASGGAVDLRATYTYDALDRRIRTEVDPDGAGPGAVQTTWTAYDGQNPYADFDGAGTLLTRYLHGDAVDELLARTGASGATAWYLPDRLGSVRVIADSDGSDLLDTLVLYQASYDAYGNQSSGTGSGGDRFRYTGRELDATGLQYHRARYYDPATGRWTQEDPIGFAAGDANLYRYVGNGPTNGVDLSGLIDDQEMGMTPNHNKPRTGNDKLSDAEIIALDKQSDEILTISELKRAFKEHRLKPGEIPSHLDIIDRDDPVPGPRPFGPLPSELEGDALFFYLRSLPLSEKFELIRTLPAQRIATFPPDLVEVIGIRAWEDNVQQAIERYDAAIKKKPYQIGYPPDIPVRGAVPVGVHAPGTAIRSVGQFLNSVDDILKNPQLLRARSPAEVEALIGKTPGWGVETLGKGAHQGQGWLLRQYGPNGKPTGQMIQWHPGGGHHGPDPYWKVSSGPGGTARVGPQFP